MDFGFYDAVGAWPIAGGEGEVFGCSLQAVEALRDALLEDAKPQNFFAKEKLAVSALSSDKSEYAYHDDVNTCRKDILEGEYFQANLSRQLTAILEGAVLERGDAAYLYEYMCAANPAAFSCLMQYEQEAYLSNSPERFFNIITSGGTRRVVAEPIKGTRQRSHDPEEDLQLIRGLARSEKDRAENIMITDLVRNDLSRICEDGTILEEKICDVQTYAHVHHLVSRVSGVLRPGQTAADILKASFPCGSITGAPKVRAMQAIADIEGRPRGIYCGSIGYVDDRGGADFSVAIRTATASKKDGALQLSYGSGGGVTVLSDPEEEWRETEAKAIIFQKLVDGLNVPGPSVP
ncbi:anthranilate synthase component I family protein [Parvularcula sp. IMCC14364]|uniref:anthranilate synthase component I family protein n=1 Tax=Parvularcula sp. IMCC14364 TaxID=3067902 RepID=UPI002740D7FE|nr:anthranilate synthase component I family protein [Parvularcula sp. IMCC14364]